MVKNVKITSAASATTAPARAVSKPNREKSRGRGNKRDATGDAAKAIYAIKFDALRSALYHGAREHWFSLLHRMAIPSGLLAGATAITSTLDGAPKSIVLSIGIFVSLLTILDLVSDWSGTAITHVKLRERFYGILSEVEQCEHPDKEITRFRARLAEAYQEEPPIFHALNEIMWNRAYEAMSVKPDPKNFRNVTGWRRTFAQLLPQRGYNFS